jgi:CHAD domain-containing protein
MAYRLALGDGLEAALRDVAREQLEKAAKVLERGDDPVEAVHDARKRLKKSRSALRLARPGMPKAAYQAENRALRDAGRALSGARDADVLVETVEKLGEHFSVAFKVTRNRLSKQPRPELDPAAHADTLRALAARADGWAVAGDVLVAGIRRSYTRGRDAFELADRDPTAEHLHEWRKRVKDLWYQERLLQEAWPGMLEAEAAEAKTLSQLLGDDHDLAVLAERLEEDGDPQDLRELAERRRAELLEGARALGRRIYAEKPKAFARRMAGYLEAPSAPAELIG